VNWRDEEYDKEIAKIYDTPGSNEDRLRLVISALRYRINVLEDLVHQLEAANAWLRTDQQGRTR
jgi:hypothetical protein